MKKIKCSYCGSHLVRLEPMSAKGRVRLPGFLGKLRSILGAGRSDGPKVLTCRACGKQIVIKSRAEFLK